MAIFELSSTFISSGSRASYGTDPFNGDDIINQSTRHAVFLVLVSQVRKFSRFNHIRGEFVAGHCQLMMGQNHCVRTSRAGEVDKNLAANWFIQFFQSFQDLIGKLRQSTSDEEDILDSAEKYMTGRNAVKADALILGLLLANK